MLVLVEVYHGRLGHRLGVKRPDLSDVLEADVSLLRRDLDHIAGSGSSWELHSTTLGELQLLAYGVVDELSLAHTHIVGQDVEMISAVDRLRAEADWHATAVVVLLRLDRADSLQVTIA